MQFVCILSFLWYNIVMTYKDIVNSEYFKNTYSKIEELKKDFYVNHGFIHINGVINNAKYLADLFGLNDGQKELLLIATALHDIGYLMGRENHALNGAVLAREYLHGKLPEEDINLICEAIASHGGKKEEDYICPVSMCLILADKLDFSKQRYQDDGKDHTNLTLFKSVEQILLVKECENTFKLNIYTTNIQLFNNLEDSYFLKKLFEVFNKLNKVCGYKINVDFVDANKAKTHQV